MGLFGTPAKEEAWNLHFRDDNSFVFRKLELERGWMIENDAKGKPVRAYMYPYKLQKQFDGYKSLSAANLTLTYPRDILFDPFAQLRDNEKPEKGKGLKEKSMSQIAAATVYRHEQEAKPSGTTDKIILFVGGVATILALSILIQIFINRGAA